MNAFLLAAGLGTRFKPYTLKTAKPSIPLLNVPLAFYNLHLMQQLNIAKVVVNTFHLPRTIKATFEKQGLDVPVVFSDEEPKILGTGGAIKYARRELEGSGTFVMANADVVNVVSLRDAYKFHHRHRGMATMIVMKHPETGKKYGAVWVNKKHEVVSIGKTKPSVECEPYHFVGIHFMEESIFKYIPEGPCDINKDVYLKAIAAGEKVVAYKKPGIWFDAGNLEDYLNATEELINVLPRLQHQPFFLSLYRRFWPDFDKRPSIWEGLNCEHSLQLGSTRHILMERNCRVHPSVQVTGFAVFGEGAVVEKNVTLHNVVIGPHVVIRPGQRLSNTLIL